MQAHVLVAHFAFQFGFGDKRGNRIDNQDVDSAGADQRIGNFERLFAGIGLGNQQIFKVNADFFGISGVKGMFGVNKGARCPAFFCACAITLKASVVLPELSGP